MAQYHGLGGGADIGEFEVPQKNEGYGTDYVALSRADIERLLAGERLSIDVRGEYGCIVYYKPILDRYPEHQTVDGVPGDDVAGARDPETL